MDDCSERVRTSNFLSATVLSCRESNSHRRSGRDTDKTVLSCLAWRCELALSRRVYLEKVGRVGEFRRRFFDLVVGRSEFYQRLVVVEAARQLLERVLGDVDELDLAQLAHGVRQPAAQIISQVAYFQKNEANYSEILRRGLLQLSASTRTKFGEGRSHMRVLPPGTLCPTTSAPCLILSSSENCLHHSILVKLLTFDDFRVSLCALASG